jgi:amidohydrolase
VDSWFGTIIGRGGHAAKPHETIDPFYISAHVIMALNTIFSRRVSAFDPGVVSVGSMRGGHTQNVIPDRVEMTGTLRYTETRVQDQIHAEIQRAFELARALGGDYELRYEIGTPPMQNHPQAVQLIKQAAGGLLGDEHIFSMEKDLGAEDFGCFSQIAPGAMFLLGTLIKGDERVGHNQRFDIDERALPIGTAILAECVLHFLRGKV